MVSHPAYWKPTAHWADTPRIGTARYLPGRDGSAVTQKDQLRSEWEKVHAGPRNGHRVAILDYGLKYKPISASNADAQFVESKEVSIRDIARYFGIPLYKLQEGKQAYGSNEQNAIEYVVGTLHPIISSTKRR